MSDQLDLRLRLEPAAAPGTYRVVISGPGGDASGEFRNPFSELELENFVLKVGGTRRLVRKIDSPETQMARDFGSRIFAALFADEAVRDVYRSSRQSAQNMNEPLRLTLSMRNAPDLLQIPWEYVYDHPDYLAISRWTPIVRYLDIPKPRPPLAVKLPIHILGVVSGPTDAPALDAAVERQKLVTALKPLSDVGGVTVDWLEEASLLALNRQLHERDYHVLHYIGHAGYLPGERTGVLLFEDADKRGNPVSGERLGNILSDETTLRLVVLNACEGGRTSADDPFSGVATSLIERGVPAAVAMQFEITDRAAILFASEFYTAIANGVPVEVAVAEARRGIYADDNQIEWGTPVLFMRVRDGTLFDVEAHPEIAPASRDALLRTAASAGLNVDDGPETRGPAAQPPVAPPAPPPPVTDQPREPRPQPQRPRPRWIVPALIGLVILLLIGAGVLLFLLLNGDGDNGGNGESSVSPRPSQVSPSDEPTPSALAGCVLTVSNPLATIHTEPDVFSREVSRVPAGDYVPSQWQEVQFGRQTQLWFEITVNGRTGWIQSTTFDIESKSADCP